MGGYKEEGARLFSVMLTGRTRGKGHRLKTMKSEHKKNLFTLRVVKHSLAQVATGCGASILGRVENTSGHGPGQLGPGSRA